MSSAARRALSAALLCLTLALSPAAADDRALEIMREVDRRQRVDSRTNVGAIEVTDRKGKVSRKRWRFWAEGARGDSKVLVRFSDPPEVRGVGLLTLNHRDRPAEQWLYTPAIQRDRRISAQEKSARFMGTDFSNEDMQERGVESYGYDLLGEDAFDGHPAYKIKGVFKQPADTQYSQLVFWVRQDIMVTTFTEFYVGGRPSKSLTSSEWQPVQGVWTPGQMEMKDLAAGTSTRIRLSESQYNVAFKPDWFTLLNLRREP
jgi:hypothetical protein